MIDGRDIISDREWKREQTVQAIAVGAVSMLDGLRTDACLPADVRVKIECCLRELFTLSEVIPDQYLHARLRDALGEPPGGRR